MSDTRAEIIDIQNEWDKDVTLREQFELIICDVLGQDAGKWAQLEDQAVDALIQAVETSLGEDEKCHDDCRFLIGECDHIVRNELRANQRESIK